MTLKKQLNATFIFIIVFLIVIFVLFNRENLISLTKNSQIIYKKKNEIEKKNKIKEDIKKKIEEFTNKKEFRELIIREKLYFKNDSEEVFFYDLNK